MYIAIDVKYTFNDILICKINLYPPPPQKKKSISKSFKKLNSIYAFN